MVYTPTDTFTNVFFVFVSSDTCVWPGDANHDKTVKINDLLNVGLAYGDTGAKRQNASSAWVGQACADWSKRFKSGLDHKHADCNGDGKVDTADIRPIVLNYGQTHLKAAGGSTGNSSDPALSLSITQDSVGTSDTLHIGMNLGTSAKPLTSIYGLTFSISYDPSLSTGAKSIKADLSKCWLGTPNKDLIYLVQDDSVNGLISVGISRTDQKSISGYGSLGILSIITPDDVAGKREVKKELVFGIEDITAIDALESDVPLYLTGDSVKIFDYKSGINGYGSDGNKILIYPNPANTVLHVDAGKSEITKIEVSNILGGTVATQMISHGSQADFDVTAMRSGIYFINITTTSGQIKSRFVKQ